MTITSGTPSPRAYARAAGLGYLTIILTGIVSEFFLRGSLIAPGDAAITIRNITAAPHLLRLSIAGDLVMLGADIAVAVALYGLLRPVSHGLSLLAAAFRLVHAAVYGASLLSLVAIVLLLGGGITTATFSAGQIQAGTMLLLDLHAYGYALGLVFFGLHCMTLAYLAGRSDFIPKIFGVLLGLAALGYLTDSFARVLLPTYTELESVFAVVVFVPAIIAELSFAVWLLLKGGQPPRST